MISIVIPVYQCENEKLDIIEDILKQSYQDYEVLLVDDGSTDGTLDLCWKYERCDARIRVIENEHQGVSGSRNSGMNLAKGEFLAFLDADDRIESDYLEELYKYVKDYDLVISTFDRWFLSRENQKKIVKNIKIDASIDMKFNFSEYFSKLYVSTLLGTVWCKLFRTDIIKKNQIEFRTDTYIGEDFIFNFDYLLHCEKIRCIPYMGYHYVCKNGNSLTHKADLKKFQYGKKLFWESVKFAEQLHLAVEDSNGIYNLYLRTIFKNIELAYQIQPRMSKKSKKSYIKKIIEDEATQAALKNAIPDTKEFSLYKIILRTKSVFFIGNFAKARLAFKKIIGRT